MINRVYALHIVSDMPRKEIDIFTCLIAFYNQMNVYEFVARLIVYAGDLKKLLGIRRLKNLLARYCSHLYSKECFIH